MAAFIAKQMVGDKLKSVKGAMGDGGGGEEGGEKADAGMTEEEREMEEARQEAEDKRKEKHRQMEEEREDVRQGIRDKYGLKKKEEKEAELALMGAEGRMGRRKKTPAELAAENEEEEDEDEFAKFPTNFNELTAKVQDLPAKLKESVGEVTEKCLLQ